MLMFRPRLGKHRHARRARVIFCDRSICRTVHGNGLVKFFLVATYSNKKNWEFMMYERCYIGNDKIAK